MASIVFCGSSAEAQALASLGSAPTLGERVTLAPGQALFIGRGQGMDVLIQANSLARSHALLTLHPPGSDSRLCVVDLQSTNGIWVFGERITVAFLAPGQSFRLADQFEFRFEA